jgi:transaldolase
MVRTAIHKLTQGKIMTRPTHDQAPLRDPQYDEAPTKMDLLVGLVSKSAKSEMHGSVHPISVRIPTIPFTTIQAISKHSGMSMNKTIVSLLEAALDEMWVQLAQDDQDALQQLRSEFIKVFMDGNLPTESVKGQL